MWLFLVAVIVTYIHLFTIARLNKTRISLHTVFIDIERISSSFFKFPFFKLEASKKAWTIETGNADTIFDGVSNR